MIKQSYEWGCIDWVQLTEQKTNNHPVNIGFLTLDVNKRQRRHIHYGEEQILYIVSGAGTQIVEQEEIPCKAGDVLYIEAGSAHETINTSAVPLIELVISFPSAQFQSEEQLASFIGELDIAQFMHLDEAVCRKFSEMAKNFKFPLTIYDTKENVCSEGTNYPTICTSFCKITEDLNNCPVYNKDDRYGMPGQDRPTAVLCPYGVTVFVSQIQYQGQTLGWLSGGHIRTMESLSITDPNPEAEGYLQDMEYVHRGRIQAILQQVQMIQKGIINDCLTRGLVERLDASKASIERLFANQTDLESAVRDSMEKLLSIQLNNHFLFNTLNSIASMALKEDALRTYQSIIDLSSMFRYNLRATEKTMALRDELGYLEKYMKLQRLRFGDNVNLRLDVDSLAMDCRIPFNSLQPIVENCFKHGFKDRSKDLNIRVEVTNQEGSLVVAVIDNGSGFEKTIGLTDYLELYGEESPKNNGLHMVIRKMVIQYGEAFDFGIEPASGQGTRVWLKLPAMYA